MASETVRVVAGVASLLMLVAAAAMIAIAQDKKADQSFAEVQSVPGQTVVVVRDARGADEMVVTTFYWQSIKGFEKPIMRSVTSVVPVIPGTAVSADGPADPKSVDSVHISLVRITDRQEWHPQPVEKTAPSK